VDEIYLGRIVAVGRTSSGKMASMYRVSSRSFPNRRADVKEDRISIVPSEGHEGDVYKNPYIAYNCAKIVGSTAIATNGSQTDPIAEKIATGMSVRDALIYSMAVMDYEKDDYNTPRVSAVVSSGSSQGWLASIRHDGLDVRSFDLNPGDCYYVSTYEHNVPNGHYKTEFDASSAEEACDFMLGGGIFAKFTNPVTAVCLLETDNGFEIATKDAR
jgi:IMP cyclohydrolase